MDDFFWKTGVRRRCEGEWRGTESNRRRRDFQSLALPTELPRPLGKSQVLDSGISINSLTSNVNRKLTSFVKPKLFIKNAYSAPTQTQVNPPHPNNNVFIILS